MLRFLNSENVLRFSRMFASSILKFAKLAFEEATFGKLIGMEA